MSETIKAGDLVVVTKMCCHMQERWLGFTFTAIPFSPEYEGFSKCCGRHFSGPYWTDVVDVGGGWSAWYLKRIPPLEELESEKRVEEIHA